jgi:hypothetical protein
VAARRCSVCLVNLPDRMGSCPICKTATDYFSNEYPADDWKQQVDDIRAAAEAAEAVDDEVERWRLEQLLAAGYSTAHACVLAGSKVDLHRAVELAGQCPPALAAQILI